MSRYKTKSTEVHATQWFPGADVEGVRFFTPVRPTGIPDMGVLTGEPGEGRYVVQNVGYEPPVEPMSPEWVALHGPDFHGSPKPGDWIVKTKSYLGGGKFVWSYSAMNPVDFAAKYEPVIDTCSPDLADAWGGISLANGASIVPDGKGGIAYSPKCRELSLNSTQEETDAWQVEVRAAQRPLTTPVFS